MFSIAGITRVGSKVSFVFDSMFGFFNTNPRNEFQTITIKADTWDPLTGAYTPGEYKTKVTSIKKETFAFFIMPGMRFQTDEKRAFQFSLAGIGVRGFNTSSFPFPMCSWFRKF